MTSSGTGGELSEVLLPPAVDGRLGELLEQHVGLAVEDLVSLLDRRVADPLGEVALARAGRPEEERVLVLRDEVAGGEVEDEAPVELAVEVKVEGVEGLAHVAETGALHAALEKAVLAALQLVLHERGDEIERRPVVGLRLDDAGLEGGGHARDAQLAQGAGDFGEGHSGLLVVMRSMRSRYSVSCRMSGSTCLRPRRSGEPR
jgi:hypothetical protein